MDTTTCKAEATIAVPLSSDEIKKKADEATKLMTELDKEEEEYKLVKREWGQKLKGIRLRLRSFCQAYSSGIEPKEVEVDRHFDVKKKETWDMYEGKEYNRRTLDPYEIDKLKQGTIFDDGPDLPGVKHNEDETDEGPF
jgi:hypothetical protein